MEDEALVVWGSGERMFLPMSNSVDDLPHHGSGIDQYERSTMKGPSAFISRFLTVCTVLPARPLPAG